ncbi:MAG: hypothetical protein ACI8PZ_002044 [Myxococcota bacterium]|jgi:hypothetical protein
MSRIEETLELTADERSTLHDGDAAHEALLALLAYMASSDGAVHPQELDFLERILPGRSRAGLAAWAMDHASAGELDVGYVVGSITQPDEQWKCIRFAARMAWKDGDVADDERSLLARLADGFGLPAGTVDRVLRETAPRDAASVDGALLLAAVQAPRWEAVQLAGGTLVSEDLKAVLPADAEVVARVGVDRVEVMALATTGVVARFAEGPAFVPWDDLVSYSRSFALGSTLVLHTEDGRDYTVVDSRLGGLALVLDRLMGRENTEERPPAANPPVVELIERD